MSRTRIHLFALAATVAVSLPPALSAQEAQRNAENGGIHVAGWQGDADQGSTQDASFTMDGDAFHIVTGPAITYWNPANTASGDYTVQARFTEPAYMNLNNHPHPYGIVIGGHDLGTDQARYLYCAAYGNGTFIVRGFGPEPFQLNGRRGEANDAVHKAAGPGEPVTQEIAVSVKGDQVQCAINGTVVGSYAKDLVVGPGKLASTDGAYGVRFGHNTEAVVSGLGVQKP
ncbi:MAG: hypothetical protein PVJ02_13055 [Gemmatimonadota bacterium]|jgi:hypothetical protein